MTLEEMPEVLTAQHIADYLGLSRYTIYEHFKLPIEMGGIPNFQVGKRSRKTLKSDFILYLNRQRSYRDEVSTQRMKKIQGVRSIS
ncbi:hypothetical protein A3842_10980 [Paenibacillus sp. P3E]|uniref:helix-turn-helix domain-containing protein n=1 Tax=Paenibacillus sp. P3E TaxID=1349435 RepID=UPI00093DA37C|nr:helix-turn-helix domain-containing protein [Paenibacillus sp. P3E]OKP81597.1 hypothetical protein A3842_10980 [Paenibacillus sp. P3E]